MANSQKNLRTRRAVPRGSSTQRHAALEYQPPKLFKVFRNFFVLGIVVVMTAVGYTLYWFVIATNLKDAVTNWIVARAQQGITASYSQIEIGGFPSNFRVVLTDPKLHTANFAAAGQSEQGAEKWFWQGQRVVAEMKPWNFKKFSVDLSGVHNLAFKNQNRDYQFSGDALQTRLNRFSRLHFENQVHSPLKVEPKGNSLLEGVGKQNRPKDNKQD